MQRDLAGTRWGRLAVIGLDDTPHHGTHPYWKCACDCGTTSTVRSNALTTGNTKSCGCLKAETKSTLRHGLRSTTEYEIVQGARARCTRTSHKYYAYYGGRGIEYRLPLNPGDAAAALIGAIGRRPPGMSLDRIDNNGHYELGNLRWSTPTEQANNRRRRKTA